MTTINTTRQTLAEIFHARSIALVGASGNPKKFGFMTLQSLLAGGFEGSIYPVNPKGGELMGLKVYKSLNEIPSTIDLVAVIVPAESVLQVIRA